MKHNLVPLLVVVFASWIVIDANAQTPTRTTVKAAVNLPAAAQAHIDKAKSLAWELGWDLTDVYDKMCEDALSEKGPVKPPLQVAPSLAQRKVPPRSEWYSEPMKVFDNLYWIGTQTDSTWAIVTSDGIILVDSAYDYSIKEATDGLRKFGLDPAQIKYVVLSHAHGDRYFGAKYLQDTYHSRIIMSEADWNTMAKSNEPKELKASKDMVATDGQKLTLGDTTITLYLTPGHTPGTISTIIPLKEGNQRHVGVVWGGMAPSYERYGVQYFPTLQETFKTWSGSIKRFQDIANKAGADVYLTIHPHFDKALEKLHALNFRKPGGMHPFVSKENVNRFLTIMYECTEAQLARVTNSSD